MVKFVKGGIMRIIKIVFSDGKSILLNYANIKVEENYKNGKTTYTFNVSGFKYQEPVGFISRLFRKILIKILN
jgi:hypothetical protein